MMYVLPTIGFLLVASVQAQDSTSFLSSVPSVSSLTSLFPQDITSLIPQDLDLSALTSAPLTTARSFISNTNTNTPTAIPSPLSFPFNLFMNGGGAQGKTLAKPKGLPTGQFGPFQTKKATVNTTNPEATAAYSPKVLVKESLLVKNMAKTNPKKVHQIIQRAAESADLALEDSDTALLTMLMEDVIVVSNPLEEKDPSRATILGPLQPLVDKAFLGTWSLTNPIEIFDYKVAKLLSCEDNPDQIECSDEVII